MNSLEVFYVASHKCKFNPGSNGSDEAIRKFKHHALFSCCGFDGGCCKEVGIDWRDLFVLSEPGQSLF